MGRPFLVSISGGSGSGKTTFVEKLLSHLENVKPLVIQTDHYYKDLSHMAPKERDEVNFDDPNAIEVPLLLEHLEKLRNDVSVQRPVYDFPTHTRRPETVALTPRPVIIVDGIFNLCDPRLVKLFELKAYIDVDADLRFARRLQRDVETRGRSVSGVMEQYFKTVKPMHNRYIEPAKFNADIIIPWVDFNWVAVGYVADIIKNKVK